MSAPEIPVADANRALPANVRVTRLLAVGGQGAVYVGTVDGAQAAVKLYTTLPYEQRVDREVHALRSVSCLAIADLLWAGTIQLEGDNIRVVATRMVGGAALDQILTQRALRSDEIGAVVYDATLTL